MIIVKNITKDFGDEKGNFDINLTINDNEVYGIIGPNGAGKTTLIRQILGFIKPDEGQISINNLDPIKDVVKLMKVTGYLPGELALYNGLTGKQYLNLVADLKKGINKEFFNKLIKHFDIDIKMKIKKMSKGMKQIIAAVMHKPKLLVLDEPTSGLDPVMQSQFEKLLLILKQRSNTTIIMCSHIFSEIVKLCDRVGFIKDGKLIQEFNTNQVSAYELESQFKILYQQVEVL